MKNIIIIIITLLFAINGVFAQEMGTFTDPRDGKTYKTVKIGNQVWFAENLIFNGDSLGYIYDEKDENYAKYGYLYAGSTALNIAPKGWHLPTDEEYKTLINHFKNPYKSLKKGGKANFNALLGGGEYAGDGYQQLAKKGSFWTADLHEMVFSKSYKSVEINDNNVYLHDEYSIRLIKNTVEPKSVSGIPQTAFTDPRDGKTYKTVKIGKQIWLAENFAFKPDSGIFLAYNKDEKNVEKYGYLYDFETAKKVVPKGWHLPTEEEYRELLSNYGDYEKYNALIKGGKSKFDVIFGGCHYNFGYGQGDNFEDEAQAACFWTNSGELYYRKYLFIGKVHTVYFDDSRETYAKSIRLIKD